MELEIRLMPGDVNEKCKRKSLELTQVERLFENYYCFILTQNVAVKYKVVGLKVSCQTFSSLLIKASTYHYSICQ